MQWIGLAAGAIVGAVATAGLLVFGFGLRPAPPDGNITFPDKTFYDPATTSLGDAEVSFSGALSGEDLHTNNTLTVRCDKAQMRCIVGNARQIGTNQIGTLDVTWEITQWSSRLIVAKDEWPCATWTINITRPTEEVGYVIVPTNQTLPICKDATTQIRKLSLGRSLFWRQVDSATAPR
jgi:hypothetical protein